MNRIMRSPNVKCLLKALLLTSVTILLISLLAYAFRLQLLTGLANYLIVDDPLQPADIIFVLNGEPETRPFHVSRLFNQRLASQIVIARAENSPAAELGLLPNETDVAVGVMRELGVPDENITVLYYIDGGATSTYDEAVTLRRYVEDHAIGRVILVTSAFHTRRSRWIFEKELSASSITLEVAAAPHWRFDATNWWQVERGLIMFANEYIKLFYYFVMYR